MAFDETICRLCVSGTGTIPIFGSNEAMTHLEEKITFCARIKVDEHDTLPHRMCQLCYEKLETAYYFRLQVENSDHILRQTMLLQTVPETEIIVIAEITEETIPEVESVEEDGSLPDKEITCLAVPHDDEEYLEIVQLKDEPEEQDPKPFQCETCAKTFKKSYQLKVHRRSHTGERPYVCNLCGKAFTVQHHFYSHMRIHTAEKPFQCIDCGKCFSESSSLSRHTKIHTNDRRYECSVCQKKFITAAEVRKHFVKHSGEKPFHCKICSKRYSDASNLSKHNKKHRNNGEI